MESSAADSSSALQVLIHPLVVMSIADHHTRTKQAQPSQPHQHHTATTTTAATTQLARVFGLLFGQQDNTTVNVLETVEAGYERDETGRVVLQQSALEVDMQLFGASYPQYECLGWYSTATAPQHEDTDIHRMIQKYNERPLYLILDPTASSTSRELPLTLYEETLHTNLATPHSFTASSYTLHADEAERITSFHCAKLTQKQPGQSELIPHYSTLSKAVDSLRVRLQVIHRLLCAVESGQVGVDHKVLREVKGLLRRLPVGEGETRVAEAGSEYVDGLLLGQLGVMTRVMESMAEMNGKFATLRTGNSVDVGSRGRARRGVGGIMSNYMGAFDD